MPEPFTRFSRGIVLGSDPASLSVGIQLATPQEMEAVLRDGHALAVAGHERLLAGPDLDPRLYEWAADAALCILTRGRLLELGYPVKLSYRGHKVYAESTLDATHVGTAARGAR